MALRENEKWIFKIFTLKDIVITNLSRSFHPLHNLSRRIHHFNHLHQFYHLLSLLLHVLHLIHLNYLHPAILSVRHHNALIPRPIDNSDESILLAVNFHHPSSHKVEDIVLRIGEH